MANNASGLKRGFLACHKLLVQRIEPTGLMINLIPKGIISTLEKDIIAQEAVPGFMTDKLLMYLHKKASFNPDVYSEFLAVMEEEETLESVVESVRAAAIQQGEGADYTYKSGVMDEAYGAALKAHERTIVAGLSAGDILLDLVSAGVVSPDENEFIRHGESSSGEQAERLLKIVRLRGSAGFLKFKDALLDSESQKQLGRLLLRSEDLTSEICEDHKGVTERSVKLTYDAMISSTELETLTNPPKLEDLMNLVAAAEKDKWNEVGIQLGSNLAELNILGSNDNSGKYFQSIFSNWRSSGRKVYKWKVLIDILASQGVDEGRLADELRRRFREDDEPKVQDLMNSVAANARAKWRRIAEQLGMTADEIDAFSSRVVPDYHQCYMTVFANWRNRAKPPDMPYTWEHLIGVLKAIPCVNTAQTLERMLKAPGKCLQETGQSIAANGVK